MFDRFRSRNQALNDEAIQWLVCLGGNPDAGQRRAFEQWRRRSPAHAQALRQATALLDDIGQTGAAAEHRHLVQALRPTGHRISRRAVLTGGMSAAAALGLVASGVFGPLAGILADHTTGVGQRRQSVLPDGSRVWLNTDSALSVAFSGSLRKVWLDAGEAFFDIAHDPQRPFVASTRDGQVHASAARYALRREAGHSLVTVLSGEVQVHHRSGMRPLAADQRIAFAPDLLGSVETVEAAELLAWIRGKLIFNRQSLASIANELERYLVGRVVVVGDPLRGLQLSGVFELDDTDALLRSVADLAKARIVNLPLLTVIH